MGDIYKDIYSAAQNCINTQFCADGGSFDSSNISLPRSLKIRVIANPAFWGFGTTGENTLIEGWGSFNNARFDFFDGFEPDHAKLKDCDGTVTGPYINEQRPDVAYRSVYDPENGDKHYANGVEDGIVRGGAESYLLDRGGNTSDNSSCDTSDPDGVFKTNPASYGIAPKILFNSDIYKNITGAWRINECSGCYTQHDGGNDLRNLDCSGAPKQHIQGDDKFATLYDPFRNRCVADGFTGESGCNSDGVIAGQYAGTISSIVRDVGVKPFLKYTFQYDGGAASGIFNGKSIGVTATSGDGGALNFFDVQHGANSTTAYAVGSQGTENYSNLDGGSWTLFDSYDPNTCCGGVAYGVDPALMNLTNSPLYHIDIGRVFNNPKNKIYSNRIDRTYNGLTVEPEVPKGTFHTDRTYVAVNEDGNGLLVESGALYEVDLACQTGVWSATGDYIYKLDGGYSTESGIGAEALSTDSGFFPLFPKTLPYYGPFDVVDRFDYTERTDQYGNRQTNRNATCYTKKGSLSVYPDCLSQYTPYTNCDPKTKYHLNNVPRIALVYRGCDFDDICSFDDSGRPFTNSSEAGRGWLDGGVAAETHPTNMDQLRRGFAGQEIQMFINLGTARAAEIKREPCCCGDPPCPGTNPPEYVEIPSPVTFPCFPKFDLRPEEYGCQDPLYYFGIMSRLGLPTDPSGGCSIPYYDACAPIQPYTTYGYIRNLCGKETNSRRETIDSLASKLHTGDYNDLNPADDTIEPLYIEFEQDVPDCCSPSGFPVGSEECDPLGEEDLAGYGEGASGELVINGAGGITYNVTAAGSGYQFGAGVFAIPTGTLNPEQRFDLTFGTAETGLSSFTSTPGGPVTPTGVTIPLTIVAGGSGAAGSGGFTYDDCSDTGGYVHYWGLTDFQGRLAYPYFRTEPKEARVCGKPAGSYVDYSDTGTILKNWPRDKVPFLVEIDHEEYCSSCSTTQMPTGNMSLTVTSLSGEYLHGMQSANTNGRHKLYGYTHNAFDGIAITPQYDPLTDTWEEDWCESGDGLALAYGQPNIGETCECADGVTMTMVPRILKGTDVPIGYSTSGSTDNRGGVNSYSPFGNCGYDFLGFHTQEGLQAGNLNNFNEHTVYMSASIGCTTVFQNPWSYNEGEGDGEGGGLSAIYGCGGCATSYPAPNSTPGLNLDFFIVSDKYAYIFQKMDDYNINQNIGFLKDGLQYTGPSLNTAWLQFGEHVCGNEIGVFDTITRIENGCAEIESTSPSGVEDMLQLGACINGNKGKFSMGFNLATCIGSRIVLYACSQWKTGVYNRYHGNSNGKFGFEVSDRFGGPCIDLQNLQGCDIGMGVYGSGEDATGEDCVAIYNVNSAPCFPSQESKYLPNIAAAYSAVTGSPTSLGDASALHSIIYGCQTVDPARCCRYLDPNNTRTNIPTRTFFGGGSLGCHCDGFDATSNYDIAYDVTYSELTNPVNGVKTQGWYGDVKFPNVTPNDTDNNLVPTYWSGENLPGIGNIGPLPVGDPIALHYTDEESTLLINEGAYGDIEVEKFCEYHTGPNKYSYVGAEVFEPYRSTNIIDGGAPNLQPELCTGISTSNEFYANCGTPVPFDTYVSGKGDLYTSNEISPRIRVVRKSVWPEIMTVHKIECDTSGYKLHVSREYFEHNRTWYHLAPCGPGACPVPKLGLIDGGGVAYQYAPVGDACSEIYYPDCADPNGGAGADQKALPFVLPMITPTDVVGPIYPAETSPCATGTEIFYQTDTDAIIGKTTLEEHPSGCMYYPAISGEQFWNFYNLLYDSGVPDSKYLTDAGAGVYQQPPDPDADCNPEYPFNLVALEGWPQLGPVFSSISEMRNNPHSCVQDLPECGGMLWNNKEFFPRKSYAVNTRIAPFGALSICEQNAQLEAPSWYYGHTGKSSSGPGTWDQSPNKAELAGGRFVDACDSDAIVLARTAIDIDDNFIHIPFLNENGSAPSVLTLQGQIHPGFTSNLNQKTCLYADPGECLDYWPEHNDTTIRDTNFTPDEYGYYLDKLVASGVHDCLFTPFKIMVDVECCPDRVGHKGTGPVGEPSSTNLNYMAKIPALTCQGWVYNPPCACGEETTCDWDQGAFFKGLTCATAIQVYGMQESGLVCHTGCVANEPDPQTAYNNLVPTGIWVKSDGAGTPCQPSYIFDPNGGDPLAAASIYFDGDYWETSDTNAEDCWEACGCGSEEAPGPGACCFEGGGGYYGGEEGGDFCYPFVTGPTNGKIYELNGTKFTIAAETLRMDVFFYNGSGFRFAGNTPAGAVTTYNCCNPGIGQVNTASDYAAGTAKTFGGNTGAFAQLGFQQRPGCDCEWGICGPGGQNIGPGSLGESYAIPMGTDVIITSFNADCGGGPEEDLAINPAHIFNMPQLFRDFGCEPISEVYNGFYPSAVKINISSIDASP